MIDTAVAVGTIKTIVGVVRDAGRLDLTQQVIDLQQTLLELLAENTDLATRNLELQKKAQQLQSVLDSQEQFVFDRDAYWRVEGESTDGPFCSKCFDVDAKTVRMHKAHDGFSLCPHCKSTAHVNPEQRASASLPRRPARRWVTDF